MKKAVLFFVLSACISLKGFGQGLVAKIDFNPSKIETGVGSVELSFILNSAERSNLDSEQLTLKIKQDEKIKNCLVLVDDNKPKAVVVLEVDIVSQNELKQLFRNLFHNLNLNQLILNDRVFGSIENIQL
jgi:hypothetical protein